MADGYARISGRPQAVVVHVDVGTQALGQGLHNASVARVPVFILAGLCPYTEAGEMTGLRTEYMHWLQEAVILGFQQKPGLTQQQRSHLRHGRIRRSPSKQQQPG